MLFTIRIRAIFFCAILMDYLFVIFEIMNQLQAAIQNF